MYMGVFYAVFVHLFHRGDENYVIFLLTGLVVWKWFATTLTVGSNSLMANAGLMNQVYLPKIVFPLTVTAVNTIKFLIILIFLLFVLLVSQKASWSWSFLPCIVLIQLLLIVAVTSLCSAIMPFFPDFKMILDNILMMFLFISGIFFDISTLSEHAQKLLYINPMAVLISMYRKVLLYGEVPDWGKLLFVILFSLPVFIAANWLHHRYDRIYPKIIH